VKQRIPVEDEIQEQSSDEDDGPRGKAVHIPGAKDPLILDSKRREKLLKSKKKLLRLKDKGTKLVFDDEGNAHPIYEMADEDKFKAEGDAEQQRRRFLEEEAAKVREADLADKAAAKEKKRVKKEKRKARERDEDGEEDDEGGVAFEGTEDALANFIADAASDEDGRESSPERESAPKRQKKWFEEEGKRGKKQREAGPETLEDLEALASGLLG